MNLKQIFTILVTTWIVCSCNYLHDQAATECDEHNHDESTEETTTCDEISFSSKQAKDASLQIETIKTGRFQGVLKTSGVLQSSQEDEQMLVATSSGIVSFAQGSITEGSAVKKGESVATISAKQLQDGDPILNAKIALEIAESEYQRAEKLVTDKIISQRDFEQTRSAYEKTKVTYNAQAQNRTIQGINITSPINGYIKSLRINTGAYVNIGDPIAVVTQNRRLQLRAEISARHYTLAKQITTANFKTSYDTNVYQLSNLNGRVLSYGKSGSENSYYIPITFEFDNIGDFIPNTFAEIYLLTTPREGVISIPITALTEEQGVYYVYLQMTSESYRKQEVVLGQNNGLRTEITKGLNEGDKVVTQGAIQLKLAASSGEIPHGHSH